MVIYKYAFPVCNGDSVAKVDMPKGAQPIRVDSVDGHPFIWAIVNPSEPVITHEFALHKTGSTLDSKGSKFLSNEFDWRVRYIGTLSLWAEMELCFYVFQL